MSAWPAWAVAVTNLLRGRALLQQHAQGHCAAVLLQLVLLTLQLYMSIHVTCAIPWVLVQVFMISYMLDKQGYLVVNRAVVGGDSHYG